MIPPGQFDERVVDMSVPPTLEDFRSFEDCPEEETDHNPGGFGLEAETVLAPDVLARKAFPILLPSPSQAILRAAKSHVVLFELLPHSRERIEIRNSGDSDPGVIGHETCHKPSPA